MAEKVVIIGGGVAGLTAAHELVERGFDVTVCERRRILGGKARSFDIQAEGDALGHRDFVSVDAAVNAPTKPANAVQKELDRVRAVLETGKPAAKTARATRSVAGMLPAEHGFRFFPGWYQHLPDTMGRIPYKRPGRTVLDNLVPAETSLFVSYQRDAIQARLSFPTNWTELLQIAEFPSALLELGLTVQDLGFFMRKLANFALTPEDQRIEVFDKLTWWEYMEADQRSREFREYLVEGVTRNSVAAKAREASAHTIGKAAIQTLFDAVRPDRPIAQVLNGPTNEVWIDPWKEYLEAKGVRFELGWELDSIHFNAAREVTGLEMQRIPYSVREAEDRKVLRERFEDHVESVRKLLRRLVDEVVVPLVWPLPHGRLPSLEARLRGLERSLQLGKFIESEAVLFRTAGWSAEINELQALVGQLLESARALLASMQALLQLAGKEQKLDWSDLLSLKQQVLERRPLDPPPPSKDKPPPPSKELRELIEMFDCEQDAWVRWDHSGGTRKLVSADYYVLAIPVEQLAFYVARSESLRRFDPDLEKVVLLSEHVSWMAGIQFYLRKKLDITAGHINCVDSEWHLTAISQGQFWSEREMEDYADGEIESMLSVDISAWDRKGRLFGKEAWNCTPDEIAQEVWAQLKASLNRANEAPVLTDEAIDTSKRWYYLDDSIVERFDRRKQGVYTKFRDVRFSAELLIKKQYDARQGSVQGPAASGSNADGNGKARSSSSSVTIPYTFGPRLLFNAEPLLINRVNSWDLRPTAKTRISNLFLAGDYVRTLTNLACMESANESARAAVNEILKASGSQAALCKIWPGMEPLTDLADAMLRFGNPARVLGGSLFETAGGLASEAVATGRGLLTRLNDLARRDRSSS